jgi:phage-related protein
MRTIIAYKRYFLDFYEKQTDEVQKKIEWTLALLRDLSFVPEKYFKHIEGVKGLYEVRVQSSSNIYRIFSFFDKQNIVLGNVFHKKSQKTPQSQIKMAKRIMEE